MHYKLFLIFLSISQYMATYLCYRLHLILLTFNSMSVRNQVTSAHSSSELLLSLHKQPSTISKCFTAFESVPALPIPF